MGEKHLHQIVQCPKSSLHRWEKSFLVIEHLPSEKATSLSWPKPMEPSESHKLLLDSKNICVFRLNSTATGSLTCGRMHNEPVTEKEGISSDNKETFSDLKGQTKPVLLAGIWCLDRSWPVLWDCRQVEQCIPYSGLLCRGSASLCRSRSSLSPVWSRGGRYSSVQRGQILKRARAHRYKELHVVILTAKSEVKVQSWTGWL